MRQTLSAILFVSVVTTVVAGASYYAIVTGSPRCNGTEAATPLKIIVNLLQQSAGTYYILAYVPLNIMLGVCCNSYQWVLGRSRPFSWEHEFQT